jgi:hypothetical protein
MVALRQDPAEIDVNPAQTLAKLSMVGRSMVFAQISPERLPVTSCISPTCPADEVPPPNMSYIYKFTVKTPKERRRLNCKLCKPGKIKKDFI